MTQHEENVIENSDIVENQDQDNQALQVCQQQVQEWKDRCFRITADFDNYKKRQEKDRVQWERIAQTALLPDLLKIVDNFERALKEYAKEEDSKSNSLFAGFSLIDKDLHKYLHKIGLQEITDMSSFNPEIHEAVMHTTSEHNKEGDIVDVLEKGYMFKGHVLRPAKVSIAQ